MAPDGAQLIWPPVLGQHSISWDDVYPLIKRPEMLSDCWGATIVTRKLHA